MTHRQLASGKGYVKTLGQDRMDPHYNQYPFPIRANQISNHLSSYSGLFTKKPLRPKNQNDN